MTNDGSDTDSCGSCFREEAVGVLADALVAPAEIMVTGAGAACHGPCEENC